MPNGVVSATSKNFKASVVAANDGRSTLERDTSEGLPSGPVLLSGVLLILVVDMMVDRTDNEQLSTVVFIHSDGKTTLIPRDGGIKLLKLCAGKCNQASKNQQIETELNATKAQQQEQQKKYEKQVRELQDKLQLLEDAAQVIDLLKTVDQPTAHDLAVGTEAATEAVQTAPAAVQTPDSTARGTSAHTVLVQTAEQVQPKVLEVEQVVQIEPLAFPESGPRPAPKKKLSTKMREHLQAAAPDPSGVLHDILVIQSWFEAIIHQESHEAFKEVVQSIKACIFAPPQSKQRRVMLEAAVDPQPHLKVQEPASPNSKMQMSIHRQEQDDDEDWEFANNILPTNADVAGNLTTPRRTDAGALFDACDVDDLPDSFETKPLPAKRKKPAVKKKLRAHSVSVRTNPVNTYSSTTWDPSMFFNARMTGLAVAPEAEAADPETEDVAQPAQNQGLEISGYFSADREHSADQGDQGDQFADVEEFPDELRFSDDEDESPVEKPIEKPPQREFKQRRDFQQRAASVPDIRALIPAILKLRANTEIVEGDLDWSEDEEKNEEMENEPSVVWNPDTHGRELQPLGEFALSNSSVEEFRQCEQAHARRFGKWRFMDVVDDPVDENYEENDDLKKKQLFLDGHSLNREMFLEWVVHQADQAAGAHA